MHFDFEVLLLVITLAATVIWALDALLWRRARREASGKTPWWVEYGCAFAPILLMVLVLRSFIVEPFRIPSNSMMPTLLTGDFIMVNKFAYGVRLPVLHTKLISVGEPSRGDVAVFRYPLDPSQDYIKRVVGVPGDVVGYRGKRLTLNGRPVPQTVVGTYVGKGSSAPMNGARRVREALPGAEHKVLISRVPYDAGPGCDFLAAGPRKIPAGHYLVMGDNRDASSDSRCWGLVPEAHLVGRAFFIWFNADLAHGVFQWSRIGGSVR